MSDPITVLPYDPVWPEIFRHLGAQRHAALGGVALRIDHIGSTAVPGLAAKPIVDVQISVVHVRRAGSFSEQFALLFRDSLRADPAAAQDYGQRKRVLAARFTHDRHGYLEAKTPIIWDVLRRADQWAQATGWEPGPSDARG